MSYGFRKVLRKKGPVVSHDNRFSSEVSLNHLHIPALCDLLVNEILPGTSLLNNQTIYAQVSQNFVLFLSYTCAHCCHYLHWHNIFLCYTLYNLYIFM